MPQPFQSTDGIILRVIPFRDYDQILTLFTQDAGMIKVIYKGSRSKRRGVQGLCIPLTKVEVIYQERNSEIFNCHEMALVDSYHTLRQKLIDLEVACDLLQTIAGSQLLGKAAPQLYALLCFYLERIPQTPNPWILAMSFRLKLLKHEGVIAFPLMCSECGRVLVKSAYARETDWRCGDHQMAGSVLWEEEELQVMDRLTTCQKLSRADVLLCSSRPKA